MGNKETKYVIEYKGDGELLDDEWHPYLTFESLNEAVIELGIEATRDTNLQHRLVEVVYEIMEGRMTLLTLKEQA